MGLILLIFFLNKDYHGKQPTKKAKVKLDLLPDIDMLLMIEKGIRRGICHVIHRYIKASSKQMKDYNKINNLCILTLRM